MGGRPIADWAPWFGEARKAELEVIRQRLEEQFGAERAYKMTAETREMAVREAKSSFEEQVKFFAPLQISPLREEQLRALARQTHDNLALLLSIEDSVQQRNRLCGTPDDVISLSQEVEEKYPGLRHVIVSFAMGTPKVVYMGQLARFAEGVRPASGGRQPSKRSPQSTRSAQRRARRSSEPLLRSIQ